MRKFDCDIAVIGAGPAGSSAALSAARKGARVLLVERKKVVGVPVRCAEYIPRALSGDLPFRDRNFICQPIKGMMTILPNGKTKWTGAPGLMIHRERLDQLLLNAALDEGAEVMLGSRAIAREGNTIALKNSTNSLVKVRAGVIVGADGPHSTVRKWMGIPGPQLIPAVQVKVNLVRPMEQTEVYFHQRIYGGYAWVFPKGEEANVGLAIAQGSRCSTSMRAGLEWFLEFLKGAGKVKGDAIGLTAGWIPVCPVKGSVKENMVLVGDAAGHTHPITGAGVPQAVLCGGMAGRWAARAVVQGDLTLLKEYETDWREDYGDRLEWACKRRRLLETNWERLEDILPRCWVAFREYYEKS